MGSTLPDARLPEGAWSLHLVAHDSHQRAHDHPCEGMFSALTTAGNKVSGEPRIIEKQGFEVVFPRPSGRDLVCICVQQWRLVASLTAHCS